MVASLPPPLPFLLSFLSFPLGFPLTFFPAHPPSLRILKLHVCLLLCSAIGCQHLYSPIKNNLGARSHSDSVSLGTICRLSHVWDNQVLGGGSNISIRIQTASGLPTTCMHTYVCKCMCSCHSMCIIARGPCSLSIMWVSSIKLGSFGFVASAFTYWSSCQCYWHHFLVLIREFFA